MSHYQPIENRKSWIRRHKFLSALGAGALVLIVLAVIPLPFPGTAHSDYRDPGQLARAIEAQEHAASADCAQLPDKTYTCSVGFTGGAIGTYHVTVNADGSTYTAS